MFRRIGVVCSFGLRLKTETKMGTYTANYNLFMPSIGEQGWGELVNGNFTTIDTTMKNFGNRIGTVETETDVIENRINAVESELNGMTSNEKTCTIYATLTPTSNKPSQNGAFNPILLPPTGMIYNGTYKVYVHSSSGSSYNVDFCIYKLNGTVETVTKSVAQDSPLTASIPLSNAVMLLCSSTYSNSFRMQMYYHNVSTKIKLS